MDDRQLLEIAAKAICLELGKDTPWRTYSDGYGFEWLNMDGSRVDRRWNPLNDDGDAFRLMADLGLAIDGTTTRCWAWKSRGGVNFPQQEEFDAGIRAAYRRAIVRAAADVGRRDA